MNSPSTSRKPLLLALAASFLLTVLIIVGSRNLEHYDSALFGYTIASVVAFGAIVFRYAIWLQRPATRVYWRRGWKLYSQREKFVQNTASAAKTFATNLVGQRFIFQARVLALAMHFLDHVGLRHLGADYVSACVWLGAFQAGRRPGLSGVCVWFSLERDGRAQPDCLGHFSRARLHGSDGDRRLCNRDSSSLARPRRDRLTAIHARLRSAYAA